LSRAPPAKVVHYPLFTATRVRNVASKYRLQHGTSCSHQGVQAVDQCGAAWAIRPGSASRGQLIVSQRDSSLRSSLVSSPDVSRGFQQFVWLSIAPSCSFSFEGNNRISRSSTQASAIANFPSIFPPTHQPSVSAQHQNLPFFIILSFISSLALL
jgi:hypothetical protein